MAMKFKIQTNKPDILRTNDNKLTLDIESRVIIVNTINIDTSAKFIQQFYEIENSGQEIIPVIINSNGGGVEDVLGIIDLMKTSKLIIPTVVLGRAYSAGAVLLSAGTKGYRYISPHSSIMIHDISSWTGGKTNDIITDAKEMKRLDNVLFSLLDENCGKEKGYFRNLLKTKLHADVYMSPKEAVRYSLADKIKVPNFSISVNVDYIIE